MKKKFFVIPAAGRSVLNPETGFPLPESGERVTASAYWERRVADRSVSLAPVPGELAGKKSKKTGGSAASESEG